MPSHLCNLYIVRRIQTVLSSNQLDCAFLRKHRNSVRPYKIALASTTRSKTVPTNCGLNPTASVRLKSMRGPVQTLLVAGGSGVEKTSHDKDVIGWLPEASPRVEHLGSICTGAFLLASEGLLDGKRAATYWKWAEPVTVPSSP